jgi:hypothetical protein
MSERYEFEAAAAQRLPHGEQGSGKGIGGEIVLG